MFFNFLDDIACHHCTTNALYAIENEAATVLQCCFSPLLMLVQSLFDVITRLWLLSLKISPHDIIHSECHHHCDATLLLPSLLLDSTLSLLPLVD